MNPQGEKARQRLTAEMDVVRVELTRVDAKCSTLVGLAGAALAFLVTQMHGPIGVRALLAGAGVLLAAAVLVLLWVLRPRLGAAGFCAFARTSPDGIARWALADEPDGLKALTAEAADLRFLSQIVDRKYRSLRRAVDLAGLAVILLAAALVAGVVA